MRVLVTGGAGYIGSVTAKALAGEGHEVVVFDNLVYGHRDFVKWGEFVEGDLLDRGAITEVLKRYRPGAVMHFAAYALVGESVRDPGKYYRNNVTGGLNLLLAMRETGVERMVFSSTCAVYGIPERLPITEDTPTRPINPYGRTKLAFEGMLEDFFTAYGTRSVSLRYFNAAGADPDGETGEDHDPETHLIPLVLDAAAGRRPSVTINGTDYDTPDGTCIRDYIHVADLARAHVLALEYLEGGGRPLVLNLGTSKGFSVREVIKTARKVTGRDFHVVEGPRRPGDPPRLVASCEKAERVLGWRPRLGSLETIIEDAWRWYGKRFS